MDEDACSPGMTLLSSASRGGEKGTHLDKARGEPAGADHPVEQVLPAHRTGRGSRPGGRLQHLRSARLGDLDAGHPLRNTRAHGPPPAVVRRTAPDQRSGDTTKPAEGSGAIDWVLEM